LLAWRYRLEQDLIALCQQNIVQLVVRDDTHFMISRADFKYYDNFSPKPRIALMAKNVNRFSAEEVAAIQTQAQLLCNINSVWFCYESTLHD
jgi:deoxyribodipyrimidine photolyase-like uncharacterized protein